MNPAPDARLVKAVSMLAQDALLEALDHPTVVDKADALVLLLDAVRAVHQDDPVAIRRRLDREIGMCRSEVPPTYREVAVQMANRMSFARDRLHEQMEE